MGINSTDTVWNFGQFGSTYLTGDSSKLDLTAATAKYYVCAVTIIEDATFEKLKALDGGVDLGMGNTHFVSDDATQDVGTDWGATTAVEGDIGVVVSTSHEFPAGITLYGMWDNVELDGGAVVCYVAPRPDYRSRA